MDVYLVCPVAEKTLGLTPLCKQVHKIQLYQIVGSTLMLLWEVAIVQSLWQTREAVRHKTAAYSMAIRKKYPKQSTTVF